MIASIANLLTCVQLFNLPCFISVTVLQCDGLMLVGERQEGIMRAENAVPAITNNSDEAVCANNN